MQKSRWPLVEIGKLSLNQSPLLLQEAGLKHAFTTRLGGQSKEPMRWFNLGRHIDDTDAREDAMINRKHLCNALQLNYERLVVPGQVHSDRIVESTENDFAKVDGIATNKNGTPILLHFADCVPVMLFDPLERTLAVVHAGWKGTAATIVKNAVNFLRDTYGTKPENIVAAIGPAIGSCCYPTGRDVAEKLAASASQADKLIIWSDNPRPDLKAINAMQLLDAGLEKIDVTDICTACQPELFYSHRQSGGKTGRQGAVACINYIS